MSSTALAQIDRAAINRTNSRHLAVPAVPMAVARSGFLRNDSPLIASTDFGNGERFDRCSFSARGDWLRSEVALLGEVFVENGQVSR